MSTWPEHKWVGEFLSYQLLELADAINGWIKTMNRWHHIHQPRR